MAKSFLLIAITLWFCLPVMCQQTGKKMSAGPPKKNSDTTQIHWLLTQGKTVEDKFPDLAIDYYKKATSLAFAMKNVRLLSTCMAHHIGLLNNEAKFEDALHLAEQHIALANELKDP